MKRGFILAIVLSIFLIGVVSAENSCAGRNQIILKLAGTTNSHGAVWDYPGEYSEEICYWSIFHSQYTGASPHACVDSNGNGHPDNVVLRLSNLDKDNGKIFNAHAEGNGHSNTNYEDVCYGNLRCTPRAGACKSYEKEIVNVSGFTNAHLGDGYTNSICCWAVGSTETGPNTPYCGDGICQNDETSDSCPVDCPVIDEDCVLTTAYWANSSGNRLTGNDLTVTVESGTEVFLKVEGTDCNDNLRVGFEIKEDDGARSIGNWDEADNVSLSNSPSQVTFTDGVASIAWNAEWIEDVHNFLGDDDPEYIFKATLTQDNAKTLISTNELKVTPCVTGCGDDGGQTPNGEIIRVIHRGIYFNGTTIPLDFDFGDDNIDPGDYGYRWEVIEDNNITLGKKSFNYSLDTPGQKTINLQVTENATGISSYRQVAILVIPFAHGALAFVNQPAYLQVIPEWKNNNPNDPNNYLAGIFSAEDSYAIDTSGFNDGNNCDGTVTCLAGNCPRETQNVPADCPNANFCIYGNDADGNCNPQPSQSEVYANLIFNWNFTSNGNQLRTGRRGQFAFGTRSSQRGDKSLQLNLTYTKGDENYSAFMNPFIRTFTLGQCIDGGDTYLDIDDDGKILAEWHTTSSSWCAGADGSVGTGDDCCSSGFECTLSGCERTDNTPNGCGDITTENACNNAGLSITQTDPNYDDDCSSGVGSNGVAVSCSCKWSSTDGECQLEKEWGGYSTGGGGNIVNEDTEAGCTIATCDLDYSEGACTGRTKTISVTAKFTPGEETCTTYDGQGIEENQCLGYEKEVPCGFSKTTLNLPVFESWQIIAGLILILGIYSIIGIIKFQKQIGKIKI